MQKRADSLAEYRKKRDFAKTPEPKPKRGKAKGDSFVVQMHDATRRHYDFRLELDGVLLSWAVTRGPSLDPADKRLAVRTEDHPLEYGDFEGTIPKGEYGGGTVMIWDRGRWTPHGDPHEGLDKGKLAFDLYGERMKGGWALVRMAPRGRQRRENWLLIKERDQFAGDADELLARNMTSVKTGRTMAAIASANSAVWRSNRPAKAAAPSPKRRAGGRLPAFRPPVLATLVDEPPEGDDWLHELKYDGYRCLVAANEGIVRCYTRSGQDWTEKFRGVADAFAAIGLSGALIDGEIVAFDANGRSDFATLQQTIGSGAGLHYFAFDLLEEGGEDLTGLALIDRKNRLQARLARLPKASPIHFSAHIRGEGKAVLAGLCAAGQEGVVSKQIGSRYVGGRGKTWLKAKCANRQEFVIGGWMPSDRRSGFRSLLLGAWRDGKLVYVGRVGTGFDDADLESLSARFAKLARKTPAFADIPRDVRRKARWVEPELVAEIAFTEFTSDGILRHPSFLGLREDKAAREVLVEEPAAVENVMGDGDTTERAGVRITSPEKVLFPEQGLTKASLIDYYEAVAELMLPHLAKRPLSLVRCPQGRSRYCFFQKHDTGGFPNELRRVEIVEGTGAAGQYFYIVDLKGIVAGVQMGVLEFHVWGSLADNVEKPDRIVFDLDPDIGLGFEDVRRAAFDLRERLAALGLKTWPMLSGGKGIHVVAPLRRRAEWPDVKAFCRGFAMQVAADAPDRYVANMAKAKRKGRIFVDYLRNERGATAIAPYSTRARDNAPVAAPISWKEAETISAANVFTVANMAERAKKVGDPWDGYFDAQQIIAKSMRKAVGSH
jgi:bifunctional non-homologous end joining protein LigD